MINCFAIFFIAVCFLSNKGECLSPSKNLPILIRADHIIYDKIHQTVQAEGNIRVEQKLTHNEYRVMHCNKLVYTIKNRKILASGDVVMFAPNGDMSQSNSLEISDDFAHGIMHAMRVLTTDQSRLTATHATRFNGKENYYHEATYSPCSLCQIQKKEPTWDLYASEVKHNEENERIEYYNMFLSIKGIPVFYLPYFSHPSPRVKRRSGLLFPKFAHSKDFGAILSTPYFWDIGPNRDLTITPIQTTRQSMIIAADYRHRFYDSEFKVSSSYTTPHSSKRRKSFIEGVKIKAKRWHLKTLLKVHPSDHHRFVFDLNRASDTTYLIRYPLNQQMLKSSFISDKTLTSKITYESLYPNSYLGTKLYMFQNDVPNSTPIIHPLTNWHHQGKRDKLGGLTTFEGQLLSLSRKQNLVGRHGTQMNRVSNQLTWRLPYTTRNGQIFTLSLGSRFDLYSLRNFRIDEKKNNINHITRLYPFSSIQWRYPFIKYYQKGSSWLIQPIAMVVSSPRIYKKRVFPMEDSNMTEIDDRSMFLINRFSGIDAVDTGHRLVGGVEQDWKFNSSKSINLFLGQTYRLDNTQVMPSGSGEDSQKSDYIGRFTFRPSSWLASRIRSAINPKTQKSRYVELGTILGKPIFEVDMGYVFLNNQAIKQRESNEQQKMLSQVFLKISSKFHDNWSLSLAQIRNLNRQNNVSKIVGTFGSLTYQDDCFLVDFGLFNKKYASHDVKPDSGFFLQFTFKNLGSFAPLSTTRYPGSILTNLR